MTDPHQHTETYADALCDPPSEPLDIDEVNMQLAQDIIAGINEQSLWGDE